MLEGRRAAMTLVERLTGVEGEMIYLQQRAKASLKDK